MDIVEIVIHNMITYIILSGIFLIMGYVVGINKVIGYALMATVLICVICIIVSGISTSIDSGVSICDGARPSILIGSFVGGYTGVYWYNVGKRCW